MNVEIEKKWLVKSDNKIVGPFSFEQLEDLLLKRQVALIDEVRDMNRRWLYIREIPELKDMVGRVRNEIDKKSEQTRTVQSLTQKHSETLTGAQTKTAELQNPELTHLPSTFTNVTVEAEDIAFDDVEIQEKPTRKKKNNPQFVLSSDPQIQKEMRQNKKNAVIIILSALILTFTIIVGFYFFKKITQEKAEHALFTKVRRYVIFGADAKAIEFFQKLPENLQAKVLPDILTLFPKLDADGLIHLDQALQQILKTPNLSSLQKSQIELIEFNKSLNLNNINEAKGHLIRAKDIEPESESVKENEAILSYLEGQNKNSSEQFLNLFKQQNKGRYLLGYGLNLLKKSQAADSDVIEKIERYLFTRIEFNKELILLQITLSLKNAKLKEAEQFIIDFTNAPIGMSQKFKIPGLTYSEIYKIEKIYPNYEKFSSQLNFKSKGLVAIYLNLEKGDGYAAQKKYEEIQSVLSNYEKTNAQIAIQAAFNRYAEMVVIEKTTTPDQLSTASHLLLLKMKKDNKSTDLNRNIEALKKEKNLISLWAELLQMNESEIDKIRNFLLLNSATADDFIPFIEAKGRLE